VQLEQTARDVDGRGQVGLVELHALAHIEHESDRSALDSRAASAEATSRAPARAAAIMLARVSAIGSDRSDRRPRSPLAAATHRDLHASRSSSFAPTVAGPRAFAFARRRRRLG
jgi:hypothetical protein